MHVDVVHANAGATKNMVVSQEKVFKRNGYTFRGGNCQTICVALLKRVLL